MSIMVKTSDWATMSFQIEIIEGHASSSYFWFRPVLLPENGRFSDQDVLELSDEFSIEEEDIRYYLAYFFYKYYDKDLTYNKRYESNDCFEWYLSYNFFTYNTLTKMVREIEKVAMLLETDYHNPELDEIKENFSISYMCDRNDADYIKKKDATMEQHISVVIDFYRRFTKRITKMMENNKNTTIISIMGP